MTGRIICLLFSLLPVGLAAGPVRFVVLGDRTGGHVPGVYARAVELANRLEPEFVITVGDQVEGYGDDSLATEREWDEYDSLVAPLAVPLHLTPGNHDIWSDASEAVFRRRHGEPCRSFDWRGVHVVVLDNSRWRNSAELPAGQLAWLEQDLGTARASRARTLVFLHKPFWYESVSRGGPDTLHALFRQYGVDAVFSGHYHRYTSGTWDGVRYTMVGSSGGALFDPGLPGPGYHVVLVEVGDSLAVTPVTLAGERLAWDALPWEEAEAAVRVRSDGLELLGAVPVSDELASAGRVRAVVSNVGTDTAWSGSVAWEVPRGWRADPVGVELRLEPGGRDTVEFELAGAGALYPVPELGVELPYAPGKFVGVSRGLPVRRSLACARADVPPVPDGVLDEACWSAPVSFLFDESGPARTDPAAFHFAVDEEYLYLAAACADRCPDSIVARARERDGPVWGDDCVGWFLQPDTAKRVLYQVYVNPAGTVFDQRIEVSESGYWSADRDWDCGGDAAAGRDSLGWAVELRVPLDRLEPGPGRAWGLNFRRKQPRLGNGDWQAPVSYDPGSLGRLVLP